MTAFQTNVAALGTWSKKTQFVQLLAESYGLYTHSATEHTDVPDSVGTFVFISNETSFGPLFEEVVSLREELPQHLSLWVCAPEQIHTDCKLFIESGVDSYLVPTSFTPNAVAQRVAAHIIKKGLTPTDRCGSLLGGSVPMRDVYQNIQRFGGYDGSILLLGETGSGKELAARELHRYFDPTTPFLAINCAAIPEKTIESELFGHVPGAFTDAKDRRKGHFVSVGQGVLFLDEIGELPIGLQAKLLRVIEEKRVLPMGSSQTVDVEAKLIFATNKNLEDAVANGTLRKDFYYRISTLTIQMPSLDQRREDIPLLAEHFVAQLNQKTKKQLTLSERACERLMQFDWDGNVRQLHNVIENAVLTTDDPHTTLTLDHLRTPFQPTMQSSTTNQIPFDPAKDSWKELELRAQKQYLKSLLAFCQGDKKQAMEHSGWSQTTFYNKLKLLVPVEK